MKKFRRDSLVGDGDIFDAPLGDMSGATRPQPPQHGDAPGRSTRVRPVSDRADDTAPGSHAGAAIHAGETQPVSPEAMVLRAGLEDCLCHLVELYGPDILDTFLQRRLRRNIAPILAHAEELDTPDQRNRVRAHALAAEQVLRDTVESVRKDPTPPEAS